MDSTRNQERVEKRRRLGSIGDVRGVVPLPRSSLYDLARRHQLPGVVRIGRRLLFDLDVIEAWIAGGGRSTR